MCRSLEFGERNSEEEAGSEEERGRVGLEVMEYAFVCF